MSDRITRTDLTNAHRAHVACLRRHGLIGEDDRLGLEVGSKTMGIGYRLSWSGESSGLPSPIGGDFLGTTTTEAYRELVTRTRVIDDVFRWTTSTATE